MRVLQGAGSVLLVACGGGCKGYAAPIGGCCYSGNMPGGLTALVALNPTPSTTRPGCLVSSAAAHPPGA